MKRRFTIRETLWWQMNCFHVFITSTQFPSESFSFIPHFISLDPATQGMSCWGFVFYYPTHMWLAYTNIHALLGLFPTQIPMVFTLWERVKLMWVNVKPHTYIVWQNAGKNYNAVETITQKLRDKCIFSVFPPKKYNYYCFSTSA